MGRTRKPGVTNRNQCRSGLVTRTKNRMKKKVESSGRNSDMPVRPINVHMTMPIE